MYTEDDLKTWAQAAYDRGWADSAVGGNRAFNDWWAAFLEFQKSKGERLLTVNEVADHMRVSRMTVYRMCHAKKIGHIVIGGTFRIPVSAYEKYTRENTHA